MDGVYFLEDIDFDANNRLIPLPEDKEKYGIVLTFAHWCHNCHGIKPEYVKLMNELNANNDKVRFYALNGTGPRGEKPARDTETSLMKRAKSIFQPFEFRGFPSVFLIDPNGDVIAEFEDERNADGLRRFLQTHIKGL